MDPKRASAAFPAQAPLPVCVAVVSIVVFISIFWYWMVAWFFAFHKIQHVYKSAKRPLDIVTGSLLSYLGGRLIFGET